MPRCLVLPLQLNYVKGFCKNAMGLYINDRFDTTTPPEKRFSLNPPSLSGTASATSSSDTDRSFANGDDDDDDGGDDQDTPQSSDDDDMADDNDDGERAAEVDFEDPSKLLTRFDLVGITERFDESLVVLKLKLGLGFQDILYLSSKNSSDTTHAGGHRTEAHDGVTEPDDVLAALKSLNDYDNILYKLANKALDQRIKDLQPSFQGEFRIFKMLLSAAQAACADWQAWDAARSIPASERCYWSDNGCGYHCLDASHTFHATVPSFEHGIQHAQTRAA